MMEPTSQRHSVKWWLAPMSALLAATLVAPLAAAKGEGVEARLDAPLPGDVEPGTTVIVSWTLAIIGSPGETINLSPTFLRVHTGDGQTIDVRPRETPGTPGHYVARFQASGGVARIEIGLRGQACRSDGSCGRSDQMFPIVEASSGPLPDTDTLQPQPGSSVGGLGSASPLIADMALTTLISTFVILSHMEHRLKGWNRH